jgi:hypothetical protein
LHGKYLDKIKKKDEQQTRKWGKYFKLKKTFHNVSKKRKKIPTRTMTNSDKVRNYGNIK